MKKETFLLYISLIFLTCDTNLNRIENVLKNTNPKIQHLIKNAAAHEIQILLTEIKRDTLGQPRFIETAYQVDEEQYFYPASTAKLPIAALTLQKIKELNANGISITAHTPFQINTPHGESLVLQDSTELEGKLTIAHLIKKIFLVSDNEAYNYLFDFLGRDYINAALKEKGLTDSQILHKFLFNADNENTWEYFFFDKNGDTLYHQNSIKSREQLNNSNLKGIHKGKGYLKEGELINEPMDFSFKNRISIKDLNGILKRLIFPEIFSKEQQFNLTESDYTFLRYWMSRTTTESKIDAYNTGEYWDSYGKFLIYGDQKGAMHNGIRIYNKVGYAYGTLTDVAYINDLENELEFFLTATILVNSNQIFNDDIYEFEQVGIPFLAALGQEMLTDLQTNK